MGLTALAHESTLVRESTQEGRPTTMGEREETMCYHGVYACPAWCRRDPDEHQYEQHRADWRGLATRDGDQVLVRPGLSWWVDEDGDQAATVELRIVPASPADAPTVLLDPATLTQLRQLLDDAEADLDDFAEQWAYPGAETDYEQAETTEPQSEEAR
ncbi:hypothetical protein AB0M47_20845 [Hamadaea sp. NPDC051192]|uniref:DUF6907 domain-containing protein n=1 Tax=Hamadaea sp. NPDC051192 TaxID=3154940 RepID=UPI00342F8DB6